VSSRHPSGRILPWGDGRKMMWFTKAGQPMSSHRAPACRKVEATTAPSWLDSAGRGAKMTEIIER
jgi:hypothetical protein